MTPPDRCTVRYTDWRQGKNLASCPPKSVSRLLCKDTHICTAASFRAETIPFSVWFDHVTEATVTEILNSTALPDQSAEINELGFERLMSCGHLRSRHVPEVLILLTSLTSRLPDQKIKGLYARSKIMRCFLCHSYLKITVLWSFKKMRCSVCHLTARASTWLSVSFPKICKSVGVFEWSTRATSCSMIGPSSRSAVT